MLNKLVEIFFYFLAKIVALTLGKKILHFIHIGKTGGTAIRFAINGNKKIFIGTKYIILFHEHFFSLKYVGRNEKVFFFIRDPINRFVSGFYSRKRKGMPRLYNEWSLEEQKAFERFNTPNELSRSLSSNNEVIRGNAISAMKNIEHVKSSYWDWFVNEDFLLKNRHKILFVGRQESLDSDFLRFKKVISLPDAIELPTDNVRMHKNPNSADKKLDSLAISNLTRWYSRDYSFIELLSENSIL